MKSFDQEECVLCCREIRFYAIGSCDHPVCYECSTRMRVLCETNECPICRSNMPMVIFTHSLQPYSNIDKKYTLLDKKYQLTFEDADIQQAFMLLLENKCKVCKEIFSTFDRLKDHVRRKHELQYCELCTENVKIFTFERKCYSRKDLARHKRVGDPDETSHRGHPLCEFCDDRYVDADELYRHLRREHFFCHFCDADGTHQFYKDYDYLRVHFRREHYLCEEGECANEKFVGAFRTDIDLKAHIAQIHSKNKSKAEARQARTLDFEFTYHHHNRPSGSSSPRGGRYNQHKKRNVDDNIMRDNRNQHVEAENIDMQSTQEFPYLSEDAAVIKASCVVNSALKSNTTSLTSQSYNRNPVPQRRKDVNSEEEFPALCSSTASSSDASSNQGRKINLNFNRQNNASVKSSNLSNQSSGRSVSLQNFNTLAAKKSPKPTSNSTNEMKVLKSKAQKESSKFEDEFPKLEAKKPIFPTNGNVIKNNDAPIVAINNSESLSSNSHLEDSPVDHFVVIKGKSKKKKQNKAAAWNNNEINELVDFKQNEPSERQLSYLRSNNNTLLNEEENKDSYKKNMVPVVTPSRIEDNPWTEKVSFVNDDFPPLAPSEPAKRQPGLSGHKKKTPPPGFNASSTSNIPSTPCNISLSSIARQIIVPKQSKLKMGEIASDKYDLQEIYRTYMKPSDFDFRNGELIDKIQGLLNTQEFYEFKTLSGKFRQSKINAAEYHGECLKILGEQGFLDIFPELVSLLPDISKQQEILAVHKKFLSMKCGGAFSKTIHHTNSLSVCNICQQVLRKEDYKNHSLLHEVDTIE